jgi:hypothetical protein
MLMQFLVDNADPNLNSGLAADLINNRSPSVDTPSPKLIAPVFVIVVRLVRAFADPAVPLVQNEMLDPSYAVVEFLSLMMQAPGVAPLRGAVSICNANPENVADTLLEFDRARLYWFVSRVDEYTDPAVLSN